MKIVGYLLSLCVFSFVTPKCLALDITLSEQQINSMLQVSFPLKQRYQDFDITFSDPKVQMLAASNNLKIKTVIVAQQGAQKLRAVASVQGQIHYNKQDKIIEIVKPSLVDFNVLDNSIPQSTETINTIKQAIGQQMPMIFLLDVKQLNNLFPGLQPKDIVIAENALIISL